MDCVGAGSTPRPVPLHGAGCTAKLCKESILAARRRPIRRTVALPVDIGCVFKDATYVDAAVWAVVDPSCFVDPWAAEGQAARDAVRRRRVGIRRRCADPRHVGVVVTVRRDVRLGGEVHGSLELPSNSQIVFARVQGAVEDLVVFGRVQQHMPQQVPGRAVLRDHRRAATCHRQLVRHRRVRIDVSRPPVVAARVNVACRVHLDLSNRTGVAAVGMDRHSPAVRRPCGRRRRGTYDRASRSQPQYDQAESATQRYWAEPPRTS